MPLNIEAITRHTTGQHAALMAATICDTDWERLLQHLAATDTDLQTRLADAAAQLHQADEAAAAAIAGSRTLMEAMADPSEEHRAQLYDAEDMLALHGHLHPSQVLLLGPAVLRTIEVRHRARRAVAALLFHAHSTPTAA